MKKLNPTIGVVAISRNEERDLRGFLDNLYRWVDEIVIVDDDSTDSSADIANAAGSKIKFISHKMTDKGGFAGQRNVGLNSATSDWILNMDVDERVPPELAREIKQVTADTDFNAFRYRRQNYFLHRPMKAGGWCSWNNPQLARNGFHRYTNKVHERCIVEGGLEKIGQIKGEMLHLNDDSYRERMRKSFQYCQFDAEKLIQDDVKTNAFKMIAKPLLEFSKKYVYQQGFRDGMPGLISAIHSACAVFRVCALVWDEQNKIERDVIEQQIVERWRNVGREEV